MRKIRIALVVAALVPAVAAVPAHAAAPTASCIGQALSTLGPAFGGDLGHQVALEAQHPEVIGAETLGEAVSFAAQADRSDCPEEG